MTNQHTIAVVDDDTSMLQAIRRLLEAGGFCALTFPSAEALLQSGTAADMECFVFDIHLPGLSGLELRQRMVEDGVERPVIFITAHDEPSTREAVAASGAVACLMKPFAGRTLLRTIREALKLSDGGGSPQGQTGV